MCYFLAYIPVSLFFHSSTWSLPVLLRLDKMAWYVVRGFGRVVAFLIPVLRNDVVRNFLILILALSLVHSIPLRFVVRVLVGLGGALLRFRRHLANRLFFIIVFVTVILVASVRCYSFVLQLMINVFSMPPYHLLSDSSSKLIAR